METSPSKVGLDLDTRILSEFIYALNIARRQIFSYPPGHPVIAKASAKLLEVLPRLLEFRTDVTIGIARDTLLVGGQSLSSANPVYRDFAENLFEARVASLTIHRDVTEEEICQFFEILRREPEQLADLGGLDRVMASSSIKSINAKGIDFSAFHTTEQELISAPVAQMAEAESTVLWKSFVNGLAAGTLDPDGVKAGMEADFDPQLMAEVLNRGFDTGAEDAVGSYDEAITSFLKEQDREQIRGHACQETLGRLGEMIQRLNPELRRKFLNSTLRTCAGRQDLAEDVLGQLPQAVILEAMEQVDAERLDIPLPLMDVLGKLSKQGEGEHRSRVAGRNIRSSQRTAEHLNKLFTAGEMQSFLPEDYRDALAMLSAAEARPNLPPEQIEELVGSLDGHMVEQQFTSVLVDLLDRGADPQTASAITRNLEELIIYFLETGDFPSLVSVHDHLTRHIMEDCGVFESPDKTALHVFEGEEFISQVLESLDLYGKERYVSIRELISRVGRPFVEPLLDVLAEEMSMSRRRLFMECLHKIGPAAHEGITARLHDRRWFFVRNLVILLRNSGDRSVLQPLGRLIGYANPKVQYEVMQTFLHFKDPRADRYLLAELESNDHEVQLNAVRLSGKSRSADVCRKIVALLKIKEKTDLEIKLKSAAIKALSEIQNPEVLPELRTFMLGRSFLGISGSTELKVEAVLTLPFYKVPEAAEIAVEVYRKETGDLARAAGKVCLQLNGKLPWS